MVRMTLASVTVTSWNTELMLDFPSSTPHVCCQDNNTAVWKPYNTPRRSSFLHKSKLKVILKIHTHMQKKKNLLICIKSLWFHNWLSEFLPFFPDSTRPPGSELNSKAWLSPSTILVMSPPIDLLEGFQRNWTSQRSQVPYWQIWAQ